MAKLDVRVGANVEKNLRDRINAVLQNDKLLTEVGNIARADIVANIVATTEPATGKKFSKPDITPEWQKRKRRLATVNKVFDAASGGGSKKARLVFTGEWIQSIKNTISRIGSRKVIKIEPTGTHSQYTGIKGGKLGDPISNKQLGQYLREQGRDWTGFPERIRKRMVTAARNFIRRELTIKSK